MSDEELKMEQRILRVMRKTLTGVVRDVTPPSGCASPLSDETVDNIKECFTLISLREKELAEGLGMSTSQPYFVDERKARKAAVINFTKPKAAPDTPE
jgi:hypothetical protein